MRMIGMPKNFIGARPGRVYSWGGSASIQTTSGTVVTFPQAEERAFSGLNVYGHSTQDGTPSPNNPVPIVSAGSVMTTGAQLFDIKKATPRGSAYGLTISIDGEEIKISGTVSSVPDDESALAFRILNYPENLYGNTFSADIVDDTGVQDCDIYGKQSENAIAIVIGKIPIGTEVNLVFRLMVNSGSTALPWEPYTGGIPGVNPYAGEINVSVSDGGTQSQTLTLSTPGGLPGIPVNSGGNYTDESGQQWICDEVNFERGVYVQYIKKIILDGTEGYWAEREDFAYGFYTGELMTKAICNYFSSAQSINDIGQTESIYAINSTLLVFTYLSAQDLDEWKIWLSQHPVTVYYALATPIETDLPAEEIAAYKALHTYSPTTTVSNDANAWMKVEYKG